MNDVVVIDTEEKLLEMFGKPSTPYLSPGELLWMMCSLGAEYPDQLYCTRVDHDVSTD